MEDIKTLELLEEARTIILSLIEGRTDRDIILSNEESFTKFILEILREENGEDSREHSEKEELVADNTIHSNFDFKDDDKNGKEKESGSFNLQEGSTRLFEDLIGQLDDNEGVKALLALAKRKS